MKTLKQLHCKIKLTETKKPLSKNTGLMIYLQNKVKANIIYIQYLFIYTFCNTAVKFNNHA